MRQHTRARHRLSTLPSLVLSSASFHRRCRTNQLKCRAVNGALGSAASSRAMRSLLLGGAIKARWYTRYGKYHSFPYLINLPLAVGNYHRAHPGADAGRGLHAADLRRSHARAPLPLSERWAKPIAGVESIRPLGRFEPSACEISWHSAGDVARSSGSTRFDRSVDSHPPRGLHQSTGRLNQFVGWRNSLAPLPSVSRAANKAAATHPRPWEEPR